MDPRSRHTPQWMFAVAVILLTYPTNSMFACDKSDDAQDSLRLPIIERRYPAGVMGVDTLKISRKALNRALEMGTEIPGPLRSVHGSTTRNFIQDREIITVHPPVRHETIAKSSSIPGNLDTHIKVAFSSHGKAIIQQRGFRGCTAAATAMLIVDLGKQPDVQTLRGRNLGTDEILILDLQKAGLEVVIRHPTLATLQADIETYGPAIVGVTGEIGGHVIIVDQVDVQGGSTRIRDPYHGWEITITLDAFRKRWGQGTFTLHAVLPASAVR